MTDRDIPSKDQVHLEWRRKDEVPDKPWSLVIVHPNGFLWTVLSAAEPMELRHGETTAGLEDLLREVAAHGKRAHSIAAHNLLRKMGLLDPPAHPKTGSAPTCEKHGVELAFEGDECWECKKERQL